MNGSDRGQAFGDPLPIVSFVFVVLVISVGTAIARELQAQLPSGPTVLCGGGCGSVPDVSVLAIPLAALLLLVVAAKVSSRVLAWREHR